MKRNRRTLAQRLGKTMHISPLRFKLQRLAQRFPVAHAGCLEDWRVDLANARGARIIIRDLESKSESDLPDQQLVNNEELVVGICQLQCLARPQILRLAAQLISRGEVEVQRLRRFAEMERIEPILAELARQALKVEPAHPVWQKIAEMFRDEKPLQQPLLHWTRLAQPVMQHGRCNAQEWKLAS